MVNGICCTPYIMDSPSSINTRQRSVRGINQTHVTITCDTTCVVDGWSLPHWTLSFLLTNYCLTRFTCILFLLLEYICFSIKLFVLPMSFFCQHHNRIRTGDPRGLNKGRGPKFAVGSRVRQTPEEGRRTYRPKHCEYNNRRP